MVYGYGRGLEFGRRGGAGFGFRGASPPWPYVGRGRGGLPRCSYPGLQNAVVPGQPYGVPWDDAYGPAPTAGEERDLLKDQAELLKQQLEDIERRLQGLEGKE